MSDGTLSALIILRTSSIIDSKLFILLLIIIIIIIIIISISIIIIIIIIIIINLFKFDDRKLYKQ